MTRRHRPSDDSPVRASETVKRLAAGGLISRRAFVSSTGGILVAAGTAAACSSDPNNPTVTGSAHLTITGLDPSTLVGGQITITALDVPSFQPITVDVPASGDSGIINDIPVGNYRIEYAPPLNHALAPGQVNPQDIVITEGATTDVTWAVVVAQANIKVVVTGLSGTAPNGGSAAILRTDLAGQSPVTLNIPLAGNATLGVTVGTYSVTYSPPAGHQLNNGVQNPQTATPTAGLTVTKTFGVQATGGGGFQTPDIVNNASFENGSGSWPTPGNGWDNFNNGGSSAPTGVVRDVAKAFAGTTAIKKVLTTGPEIGGAFHYPFYFPFAPYPGVAKDRIWTRFYFYIDAVFDGILKLQLFNSDNGIDFGGLFLNGGSIAWVASEWLFAGGTIYNMIPLSGLLNGWHSLECDYWRNGDPSGFASVAFYLDDNLVTHADGAIPNTGSANAFWASNRIQTGKRDTVNLGTHGVGDVYWYGIKNAGSTVLANIWADRVAISSLGRIGP